jgi:hypothetical protein
MIPTEYLFFYYGQNLAWENQKRARATRGEELAVLNGQVLREMEEQPASALKAYRRYLNRRNASYMRLEGAGGSAFDTPEPDWDPFCGETGYHRIRRCGGSSVYGGSIRSPSAGRRSASRAG